MNSQHLALVAAITLLPTGLLSAASLTTGNFAGYNTAPGDDLVGQHSWASNDNTDDLTFFVTLNGNNAAGVGGLWSAPALRNVDVYNSYGGSLVGTTFDVNFYLSGSTPGFPDRDSFGWTFKEGSNTLLRIAFEPNLNPGGENKMEVVWYNPSGTRTSSGFDIFYGSSYSLSVDFLGSGADATFNAAVTGGGTIPMSGTLAGKGASTLQTVGADFDVTDADPGNSGDNYMAFNQLTVVPEPGSVTLILAALAGLTARRRATRAFRS
ncbi:MAG: PEP-CTERM sorting domain-containing protein [Verrucomicrobiales bacterium]|nr:PEP-CTERM sorting domain-containing protein [Verrucomicrobiales bacterium]